MRILTGILTIILVVTCITLGIVLLTAPEPQKYACLGPATMTTDPSNVTVLSAGEECNENP